MSALDPVLDAQADRLTDLMLRIGALARQWHINLDAAGDEAVRRRLLEREDWDLLCLIRRAVGIQACGSA